MSASSLLDIPDPASPYPASRVGISTVPLRGGRWRVTRGRGEIIGHLERVGRGTSARYRGRRMRARSGGFVDLGEFASAEDALDVVRG